MSVFPSTSISLLRDLGAAVADLEMALTLLQYLKQVFWWMVEDRKFT